MSANDVTRKAADGARGPLATHEIPRASRPPRGAFVDDEQDPLAGLRRSAALARECPQTISIVLSGSTDFDLAISSINVGRIFRYLVKPCPAPALVEAVQAALRSREDTPSTPVGEMSAKAAIDMLKCGVIVLGERGQVLFTNQRAGALLARRDGVLVENTGICRASSARQTRSRVCGSA